MKARLTSNPAVARIFTKLEGVPPSLEFRVRFYYDSPDGAEPIQISAWHDIPYKNADGRWVWAGCHLGVLRVVHRVTTAHARVLLHALYAGDYYCCRYCCCARPCVMHIVCMPVFLCLLSFVLWFTRPQFQHDLRGAKVHTSKVRNRNGGAVQCNQARREERRTARIRVRGRALQLRVPAADV